MKSYGRLLVFVAIIIALLGSIAALSTLASAAPIAGDKDKEKEHEGKNVDSGSFSVFQNGHRVGTETFSIYQTNAGSVIQSEFKTEHTPPDVQSSELYLTATGDLHRYEWKELSPELAQSAVTPNEDFLNQKWRSGEADKEHEQPYLLPPSTMILDDYFFIHREVLAWRYLAAACKQDNRQVQCPLKQRAQMGTLNPHQHASAAMSVEFLGREKVNLKSGPQDLLKLELKNESGTWQLWLDDQFKVMRMTIVGENTEVLRD
ncbi:MAG TPA: hypothetical protein VK828_02140 [Terriglobales bacterium]|nr:hypothetical protein [Terriglobales bacterium]